MFLLVHIDENTPDRSVKMQIWIYEENRKGRDGYFLKFDTPKDYSIFINKVNPTSSLSSLTGRSFDDTSSISSSLERTPTKTPMNATAPYQTQMCIAEYNKLIIYCQGVKLKELNINKAQDLLGKFENDLKLFIFFFFF